MCFCWWESSHGKFGLEYVVSRRNIHYVIEIIVVIPLIFINTGKKMFMGVKGFAEEF